MLFIIYVRVNNRDKHKDSNDDKEYDCYKKTFCPVFPAKRAIGLICLVITGFNPLLQHDPETSAIGTDHILYQVLKNMGRTYGSHYFTSYCATG